MNTNRYGEPVETISAADGSVIGYVTTTKVSSKRTNKSGAFQRGAGKREPVPQETTTRTRSGSFAPRPKPSKPSTKQQGARND